VRIAPMARRPTCSRGGMRYGQDDARLRCQKRMRALSSSGDLYIDGTIFTGRTRCISMRSIILRRGRRFLWISRAQRSSTAGQS